MEKTRSTLAPALTIALVASLVVALGTVPAQAAGDKARSAHKTSKNADAQAAEAAPEPASPAQIEASERVYLGAYACEFNQKVVIAGDSAHRGYVTVRHGKTQYLMRPVLSPTGAVRLEDVHGEGLVVQIASKSMLLNVKTGHRVVDNCVCPEQRALIEAARVAKASQAKSSGASVAALLLPTASAASAPKR